MTESLEWLIASRKTLIETLERNSFADGIHRLLTDIYPDTAHFVYELLQNAEDVEATQVRFDLSGDGVYFAHNGKREFTLDDVEAITSIGGNIGKREDSTSIGEFGVGFKAVFSYTATPEIHSGGYHFCIHDFFVPDIEGVDQAPLNPSIPSGWTEFYFPFNSPTKTASVAYDETLKGLQRLGETSLLFLTRIARIDYSYGRHGWERGFVERSDTEGNRIVVSSGSNSSLSRSEYLRYVKEVEITSNRGKTKTLPIGIAYRIDPGGSEVLPMDDARTFIYFPADKERSNLKFHINAPFSATVARDGIRDCEDNAKLMRQVAELVVESLEDIKRRGLISTSFYAVMPNGTDVLEEIYAPIREAVLSAFENGEYLVSKEGGYLSASGAMIGPRVFSDIVDGAALKYFVGTDRGWAATPPLKNVNRREENFLESLPIRQFGEVDFADSFCNERSRNWFLEYAKGFDAAHIRLLYLALASVVSVYLHGDHSNDERERNERNAALSLCFNFLKQAPIAMCTDGVMRSSKEVFFLPDDLDPSSIRDPLIDPVYVDDSYRKLNYIPANVRQMFANLGVSEYSLRVELERLLKKYSKEVNIRDRNYYRDIITIAHAHNRGIRIDFGDKRLFIARPLGGERGLYRASEVAMGSAYGVYLGDQVAQFTGAPLLDIVYLRAYTVKNGFLDKDLEEFSAFLKSCGAATALKIERSDVKQNPNFNQLSIRGKRVTSTAEGFDYTMKGLPESLESITYEMSFEIWKVLCANGSTPKYAQASYRPNKSTGMATLDSSLIAYLKAYPWIPDASGTFHRPGSIAFQDIDRDFQEIAEGKLIEALDIGVEISAQRTAEKQLETVAASMGKHLIDDEEFKMLQEFKKWRRKTAERNAQKTGVSSKELFEKQDRLANPIEDAPEFDTGSVSNPERRAQSIAETIRDQKAMPVRRQRRFSYVYAANKAERQALLQWYSGTCQICGTAIPRSDGRWYFEAINIIDTRNLPDALRNTLGLAWNSLCLCPNCAAKYRYSAKKISGLIEQIESERIVAGDPEEKRLEIELAGRTVAISFVPKHLLALKEGIKTIDDSEE